MIDRRRLLGGGFGGAAALSLAASPLRALAQGRDFAAARPPLVPILARPDRMFAVTVCLRPFRAAGPRIEVEQVGAKRVVHHYGHGGSGWSLSWGSALEAVPLALASGATEIAVIGAGAIGLTTAITAQRMGARVTIYARERFPQVRSARATGTWSPDSRIAMDGETAADFADRWERMARASFAAHLGYLGLADAPVEWTDRYSLSDEPPVTLTGLPAEAPSEGSIPSALPGGTLQASRRFMELEERLLDLIREPETLAPEAHPFAVPYAQRSSSLTFNVAGLSRTLEQDFQAAGGRFVRAEFHSPADLAGIRESAIVNCTGYGARALFGDASVIPVRGQIAWLIPQANVAYGIRYNEIFIIARRDGIAVQPIGADDFFGFDDADEAPDYAAARAGIDLAATLFRDRR